MSPSNFYFISKAVDNGQQLRLTGLYYGIGCDKMTLGKYKKKFDV